MERKITLLHCLKCGHEWWPRVTAPRLCPNCRQDWRKPYARKPYVTATAG